MILKLATRNLFRNRWRSALTVGGIAVAAALLTWTTALMDGMVSTMVGAFTGVELGQIQVHTEPYAEQPSLYDAFAQSAPVLEDIERVGGVEGATERVHALGLVGHESRSQIARIVGVSPQQEPQVTALADGITSGRWLNDVAPAYPAAREVLIGETFAQQLDIGVGDELILFLQAADGSLGNDLLEVVGVFFSGNAMVDRQTVVMHLADVQFIAALEGRVHEIAIRTADIMAAPRIADDISTAVFSSLGAADLAGESSLLVRPWQEIVPELNTMLELYDMSIWLMFAIIMAIVALGILNTQRMSALERRREFGVLLAVGLKPGQLGRMIVAESILLSLIGAVIGTALGLAISFYQAEYGLDMTVFSERADLSMMGVSFSDRLYCEVTATTAVLPLAWTAGVAFFCGLWPAFTSARLNTTQAISGRTD